MKIIQKLQNAIIWSCCRVEPSLFYIFSIYPYPSNFLLLFHPTTIFWLMVESRPQGLCNFCTWPEPISISCTFKNFQISIKLELLLQQKSFFVRYFVVKMLFLFNISFYSNGSYFRDDIDHDHIPAFNITSSCAYILKYGILHDNRNNNISNNVK